MICKQCHRIYVYKKLKFHNACAHRWDHVTLVSYNEDKMSFLFKESLVYEEIRH